MARKINEKYICLISLIAMLFYRIYILVIYSIKYVDMDQAALWYYTAAAGHFDYLSFNFPGQNYGSGLEAILAIPLYWLRIPLNVALPIVAMMLWILPCIVLFVYFFKREKYSAAALMMLSSFMFSVDVDVVCSMSRGFLPGLTMAFVSIFILLKENVSRSSIIISSFLMVFAFFNNENSLAISLIGLLYIFLYRNDVIKTNIKCWILSLVGFICVLSAIRYLYYVSAHNIISYSVETELFFSYKAFDSNLENLGQLLSDFSAVSIKHFPVLLIILLMTGIGIAIEKKEYKLLILIGAFILGSLSFLVLIRMCVYTDAYLYRQSRMFLFVPIIILMLAAYFCMHIDYKMNAAIITGLVVGMLTFKVISFNNNYERYINDYTQLEDLFGEVDSELGYAKEMAQIADSYGVDCVIFNSDKNLALLYYVTAAVNYNQYFTYSSSGDRFNHIYEHSADEAGGKNILVFNYVDEYDSGFEIYTVETSLRAFMRQMQWNQTLCSNYYHFDEAGRMAIDIIYYIYMDD